MTRVNRRFVQNLAAHDGCAWTRESLGESWKVAVSGEPTDVEVMATIGTENSLDGVIRWHRYLLDAELTALVLEARRDKAASREGAWPERLTNLESAACPGRFFRYQRGPAGVVIGFEGAAPGVERGLVLPLSFRGPPPPPPTPSPKATARAPGE